MKQTYGVEIVEPNEQNVAVYSRYHLLAISLLSYSSVQLHVKLL